MEDKEGIIGKGGTSRNHAERLARFFVIYNSTKNVNLNTIISYVKDGKTYRFMDDYNKKGKKNNE